jgi:hypothetical protein
MSRIDRMFAELESRSQRDHAVAEWERRQPVRNLPPCFLCGTTTVKREWGKVMPSLDGTAVLKSDPICDTCNAELLAIGLLAAPVVMMHERRDVCV